MEAARREVRMNQAYVSTRQHTSAYVSIRQHTSAYVSIPARRDGGRTTRGARELAAEARACRS